MRRSLDQLAVSLRPGSVAAIDTTMRLFAGFVADHDPGVVGAADVARSHIEAFKLWPAARPGRRGRRGATNTTISMRLGHLRSFFARIIEWDYPDAPPRVPVFFGDLPIRTRPLQRFLDDPSAARFIAAARDLPDAFDQLAVRDPLKNRHAPR